MIAFGTAGLPVSQGFVSRSQVTASLCSDRCVLRSVPENARAARLSPASETPVLVAEDRLFLNVTDRMHPTGHVLHVPSTPSAVAERAGWLRTLGANRQPGIVNLHGVCECAMSIELVAGTALVDGGSRRPWHLALFPDSASDAARGLPLRDLVRVLAELAAALAGLHQRGFVHGDPFASNAVVTPEGRGVWIDLNSVLPINEELRAADIWGFTVYAALAALAAAPSADRSAVEALLVPLAEAPASECLTRMAAALEQAAAAGAPQEPMTDAGVGELASRFASCGLDRREDALGAFHRRASAVGAVRSHAAFLWNRQSAVRWEKHFEAERIRHRLVEQELNRTLMQRFQGQLDELRAWIAELEKAKAWNSEQRVSWEAEAGRLRASYEPEMRRLHAELETARAEAARLAAELSEPPSLRSTIKKLVK